MRHARKANTGILKRLNHEWGSQVLGMALENPGPDLLDENKFVELKFCLINPKPLNGEKIKDYPKAWTVEESQMEYDEYFIGMGFWGMTVYELSVPVRSIRLFESAESVEKKVLQREMYIVRWSWMDQFPSHETEGKTQASEWKRTLRYPKFESLPKTIERWKVHKGYINFTQGVDPDYFT
ncbi:MAG: hypothetical protein RL557_96 [archaeon]|jgi:hypothetical protein